MKIEMEKMGDYAEACGEDAKRLATVLGMTWTKNRSGQIQCGVPMHAFDRLASVAKLAGIEMVLARQSCNYRSIGRDGKPYGKPCGKVTEPGEEICPHHILLVREHGAEMDGKMAKARAGKDRKKLLRDMLETSPLACPQIATADAYEV